MVGMTGGARGVEGGAVLCTPPKTPKIATKGTKRSPQLFSMAPNGEFLKLHKNRPDKLRLLRLLRHLSCKRLTTPELYARGTRATAGLRPLPAARLAKPVAAVLYHGGISAEGGGIAADPKLEEYAGRREIAFLAPGPHAFSATSYVHNQAVRVSVQ